MASMNATTTEPAVKGRGALLRCIAGWREVMRDHPAMAASLLVILAWLILIAGAGVFAVADPLRPDIMVRLKPPSFTHPFGTDQLGRDVFTRVLFGGRSTLFGAIAVVAVGAGIGTLLGAVAGAGKRWLDELIMRITDMVLSFPIIILAMAVAAALGASLAHGVIALAAAWWPQYARVTRGLVLELKSLDYVAAAHAAGRHPAGVLLRVILPNALPTLMVMAAVDIGRAILNFAMLSFLGLGARPPAPEWGAMVADGAQVMDQWWVATCPALSVLTLVMAFNMIGDSIRDRMDPWLRQRR
jgi:peptide/nickel transport system permease protein